ncbi:MAG: 2-phosphosulfolactate phosphatase [Thermodesulfobacteriota bacterium]
MRADIQFIHRPLPVREDDGKVFVVIDVLRATTTIIEALSHGCTEVIPVVTVDEAFSLAKRLPGRDTLIGGEEGGLKVDRFDLGNSPREYTRDFVSGKRVILTTTNGTKAVQSVADCEHVFVAGFTNAHVVVQRCSTLNADPVMVPAGMKGRFSLEDVVCGGMLIDLLEKQGVALTDGARASRILYKAFARNLLEMARTCEHGRELMRLGFEEDVAFCVQTNVSSCVPVFKKGSITLD